MRLCVREGVESVFGWHILAPQSSSSHHIQMGKNLFENMIFSIFYNDRRRCYGTDEMLRCQQLQTVCMKITIVHPTVHRKHMYLFNK